MKHLAHPILGDATHGKGPLNRAVATLLSMQRLWLHALRFEMRHPVSGAWLRIEASPGPEWKVFAEYRAKVDDTPAAGAWQQVSGAGSSHEPAESDHRIPGNR